MARILDLASKEFKLSMQQKHLGSYFAADYKAPLVFAFAKKKNKKNVLKLLINKFCLYFVY